MCFLRVPLIFCIVNYSIDITVDKEQFLSYHAGENDQNLNVLKGTYSLMVPTAYFILDL